MYIVPGAKIRQSYRSILDVPARPSLSPRTLPEYLARLLALPQSKVSRMLLPRIRINPVNRKILKLLMREFSVARKLGNVEINISIHPVSHSLLQKSSDLIDNLGNMIRSLSVQINTVHVEFFHVLEESLRQAIRQSERLFS